MQVLKNLELLLGVQLDSRIATCLGEEPAISLMQGRCSNHTFCRTMSRISLMKGSCPEQYTSSAHAGRHFRKNSKQFSDALGGAWDQRAVVSKAASCSAQSIYFGAVGQYLDSSQLVRSMQFHTEASGTFKNSSLLRPSTFFELIRQRSSGEVRS